MTRQVSLAETSPTAMLGVFLAGDRARLRAQHIVEWKADFRDGLQLLEFSAAAATRGGTLVSNSGRDIVRLPVLFAIAVASLSVAWLSLQADWNFQKVDDTAPAVGGSEAPRHFDVARAANQTTAKILALDETRRLAFWTLVLKNRRQTCDIVVRASYTGANGSGIDQWAVVCRDGNEYSISVEPNAKDSVCVGNAFDRSALGRSM